jgi:Glycosyl hydrolase family 63 C-terminal domain
VNADTPLWRVAASILDGNWSGDHTVPSRTLYPHQWSWDAGFIAVGLAHHNAKRGWRDLRSLFEAQWPDGRVPHIVFDPGVAERDYFPGPAFWTVAPWPGGSGRPTSGVTQPPVHAMAAWRLYQRSGDVDELRWLYPRLVAQQEYLARWRDIGGGGLASIVHPWESGLDNSPAWDPMLSAVPTDPTGLRRYQRRDLAVSVPSHRPTDADYGRYLTIAESYRGLRYQDPALRDMHPFLVECPSFNAIRGAAEAALADIAAAVGADPAPHRERAAGITAALTERLFTVDTGMFHALDVRTGRLSPARYIGGLVPLILADLPPHAVTSLLASAASPAFGLSLDSALPLPSYDRTATDFDPLRYWRGPVWLNMNWLLWRGLTRHGRTALADALRAKMLALVDRAGCYEYFDPSSGTGIGSPTFSWTAALTLDLLASS